MPRNYGPIANEMAAILFARNKFHNYVYGQMKSSQITPNSLPVQNSRHSHGSGKLNTKHPARYMRKAMGKQSDMFRR